MGSGMLGEPDVLPGAVPARGDLKALDSLCLRRVLALSEKSPPLGWSVADDILVELKLGPESSATSLFAGSILQDIRRDVKLFFLVRLQCVEIVKVQYDTQSLAELVRIPNSRVSAVIGHM